MTPQPSPRGSLRPLSHITHADRVQVALAAFVAESALKPGDRLPSERALAEQLGVGRSTIREALQAWQAKGIVTMRMGSGTYLERPVGAHSIHVPMTFELERQAVLHALELRRAIETDAARLAAARASEADLARLNRALVNMEQVYARQGIAVRQDKLFHEALYIAAGNPLYLQIFQQVITRISDAFNAADANPFVTEAFADLSQPDHRRLYEAVAQGDGDGAVAAVTRILDFVEGRLRDDIA